MTTETLAIQRKPWCKCATILPTPDFSGYELWGMRGDEQVPCPHGSVARELRAEDIPADLAAKALGLSAEDMNAATCALEDSPLDMVVEAERFAPNGRYAVMLPEGLGIHTITGWGAHRLVNADSCGGWVAQHSKQGWSFGSSRPVAGERRSRGPNLLGAIRAASESEKAPAPDEGKGEASTTVG